MLISCVNEMSDSGCEGLLTPEGKMTCPKCSAENPPEARFCGKCGAGLASVPPVPPPPKKGWLTLPLLLVGGLIVAGGLAAVVIVAVLSARPAKPYQPYVPPAADDTSYVATPEPDLSPPPAPVKGGDSSDVKSALPPQKFVAVSDTLYTQKIIGTWRTRKVLPTGAILDTQAHYGSDGYATWSGSLTYLGQSVFFTVYVGWGVRNGTFYSRVQSSNIPQLMPVGSTAESRIISLDDQQWTYVDPLDGQTTTAFRVN